MAEHKGINRPNPIVQYRDWALYLLSCSVELSDSSYETCKRWFIFMNARLGMLRIQPPNIIGTNINYFVAELPQEIKFICRTFLAL